MLWLGSSGLSGGRFRPRTTGPLRWSKHTWPPHTELRLHGLDAGRDMAHLANAVKRCEPATTTLAICSIKLGLFFGFWPAVSRSSCPEVLELPTPAVSNGPQQDAPRGPPSNHLRTTCGPPDPGSRSPIRERFDNEKTPRTPHGPARRPDFSHAKALHLSTMH